MGQEIERRFALDAPPPEEWLAGQPCTDIRQGYVLVENGNELRVRDKGGRFLMTRKSGHGLIREEVEEEVSQAVFDLVWPLTQGRRVEKRRHHVRQGELQLEVDQYFGALDGFWSLEVEFDSAEQAHAFQPPDFVGLEVTQDKRFNNAQLALHGLPDGAQTA